MTTTERTRHARRRALAAAVLTVTTAAACDTGSQPTGTFTPAGLTAGQMQRLVRIDSGPRAAATATPKLRPKPRVRRWYLTPRRTDPSPSDWSRIRMCESGRDESWRATSNSTARGYYQFLRGTWASVGGHGDPAAASFAEQTHRALLLYRREGWTPWRASAGCTGLRGAT